jgi:hypothetical protein
LFDLISIESIAPTGIPFVDETEKSFINFVPSDSCYLYIYNTNSNLDGAVEIIEVTKE